MKRLLLTSFFISLTIIGFIPIQSSLGSASTRSSFGSSSVGPSSVGSGSTSSSPVQSSDSEMFGTISKRERDLEEIEHTLDGIQKGDIIMADCSDTFQRYDNILRQTAEDVENLKELQASHDLWPLPMDDVDHEHDQRFLPVERLKQLDAKRNRLSLILSDLGFDSKIELAAGATFAQSSDHEFLESFTQLRQDADNLEVRICDIFKGCLPAVQGCSDDLEKLSNNMGRCRRLWQELPVDQREHHLPDLEKTDNDATRWKSYLLGLTQPRELSGIKAHALQQARNASNDNDDDEA
jgi:hypothetical protein